MPFPLLKKSFPFKLQLSLLTLLLPLSTPWEYSGVTLDSESWFLNQPVEDMTTEKQHETDPKLEYLWLHVYAQ